MSFWVKHASVPVAAGVAAGIWAPPAPAAPVDDTGIEARPDASVRIGGADYASWSAYFSSAAFREHGGRCGTDTRSNIGQQARVTATDCSLEQTVPSPEYAPSGAIVIPVVWHVIEASDGTGALSDDRIHSQMDVLNEDFRAWPHGAGNDGEDTRIHFVLAAEDPEGRATTGIERYESDAYFADAGGGDMQRDLAWDPDRYLNIYTNNATLDGQVPVLGYATLPQVAAGAMEDGVVLHYSIIGRDAPDAAPYDQGRTATHEVGHYLGLLHPFDNGCGESSEPYTTGDLIADTPPEEQPTFVCESSATACDTFPSIDNYMSYTPDECMAGFTEEQVLRMRCSTRHYRPALFEERALPEVQISATRDGRSFEFTDETHHPDGDISRWHWDFGDGTTSTERHPSHTYDESDRYTVTLSVTDEVGLHEVATTEVVANLSPEASFEAEVMGHELAVVDTSEDPDGAIVSWRWDFGDGNTSSAQNPRHRYYEPGAYTAVLVVTDDRGDTDTAEVEVVVGDPAGCGCGASGGAAPLGTALLAALGLTCLTRRRRPR